MVPNRPAYTPEHNSICHCSYTHTVNPKLTIDHSHSLCKATNHILLVLEPQKPWFQKTPKSAETCLDKPALAQGDQWSVMIN